VLWKVTLKHAAGTYALDLTYAQSVYHRGPIIHWEKYLETRIKAGSGWNLEDKGTMIAEEIDDCCNDRQINWEAKSLLVNGDASRCMVVAIKAWLLLNKMTVTDLFLLEEDEFRTCTTAIIEDIVKAIECRLRKWRREGGAESLLDVSSKRRVADARRTGYWLV
jgi:hypothetical protein